MSWCGLHGHDQVVTKFRHALRQGRLGSTFLFVGPSGIGKAQFARRLAQALQCAEMHETALQPCEECEACKQVMTLSHPDVELVVKPEDRSFIPIEKFIGDKEHRNREGLCHWIGLKPAYGKRKIAIIDDADYLNQEGANCLLKTLEEPPACSIVILIGTSQQRQLPTIRSRCQIVRFEPLDQSFIADHLMESGIVEQREKATFLAAQSEGSLDRAIEWADDAIAEFRKDLLAALQPSQIDTLALAKSVAQFVEAAGKEASSRRVRLRQVIEMVIAFLRGRMTQGLDDDARDDLPASETISHQIERCIEAQRQVASNANLATLIDCWIDDVFCREVAYPQ